MTNWFEVYETRSLVRIKDKTLGITYYVLVFLVILWAFFTLIWSKGYLEIEQPVGAISFTLEGSHTTAVGDEMPQYCKDGKERDRGCGIFDAMDEKSGGDEIMITTFIEDVIEERVCFQRFLSLPRKMEIIRNKTSLEKVKCDVQWKEMIKFEYYVALVENMRLIVRHSMKAHHFFEESDFDPSYSLTDDQMRGVLIENNGTKSSVVKRFPIGEVDTFVLTDLLPKSRYPLGLDTIVSPNDNKILRETGVHLQLDVMYNNIRCNGSFSCMFGTVPMTYRYRVYDVPAADFKLVEYPLQLDYSKLEKLVKATKKHEHPDEVFTEEEGKRVDYRIKRTKRGILIQAKQGGKIGRFSLEILVFTLSSSLGLFTLVIAFIDLLALYILPNKRIYNKLLAREFLSEKDLIPIKEAAHGKKDKNE